MSTNENEETKNGHQELEFSEKIKVMRDLTPALSDWVSSIGPQLMKLVESSVNVSFF